MGARGTGHVFRPTYTTPTGGELRTSSTWAYRGSLHGKRFGKSGFPTKTEARKALDARRQEMARGVDSGKADRITLADLVARMHSHYAAYRPKSLPTVRLVLKRVLRVFDWPARLVDITDETLERYVAQRRGQTTPATINLELQYLRRGLKLCLWRLGVVLPYARRLKHKPGWGTFRPDELERLLEALPAWWRAPIEANAIMGWRLRSELLTRTWPDVDFEAGWIYLGDSKNDDSRRFPLIPQVREILLRQRTYVDGVEAQTGRIVPWLFPQPSGAPLRDIRKVWRNACRRAGIVGRKPHHLRYTALQEFDAAGLSRSAAQAFSGQRTSAIFDDYARPSGRHLKAAGEVLAAHLGKSAASVPAKVVGIESKKKRRA